MSKLQDKCDEVKRLTLKLSEKSDETVHRPEIGLWLSGEADEERHISMVVGPEWSGQERFIDLDVDEARILASNLAQMADTLEAILREDDGEDDESDNDN